MKKFRWLLILLLSLIFVFAVASFLSSKNRAQGSSSQEVIDPKAVGKIMARVKILEYTDFQCPACAYGAKTIEALVNKYPEDIYLRYNHYPLEMHPQALKLAVAAECAAHQGKFWAFHDLLFQKQRILATAISLQGRLLEFAESLALGREEFKACLENKDVEATVLSEKKLGKEKGVNATPTYFVNGKRVVGAKAVEDEIRSILEKENQ